LVTRRAIIVFLRVPELGKVKTRLAATLGDDRALAIYQQLTAMTMDVIQESTADILLFYYPEVPPEVPYAGHAYQQMGSDLGEKIAHAFSQAFLAHDHVLIVGTDCPYLTPKEIDQAFLALERSEVVIGPAIDGGYYLLGLSSPTPSLFMNIDWSTDQVLSQTVAKARSMGFSFELLNELSDIDNEEDWSAYLASKLSD